MTPTSAGHWFTRFTFSGIPQVDGTGAIIGYDPGPCRCTVQTDIDPLFSPAAHPGKLVLTVPAHGIVGRALTVSARLVGINAPYRVRWFIDGHLIFTGRTGTVRFLHAGVRTVKAIAVDRHGHTLVTKTVRIRITR